MAAVFQINELILTIRHPPLSRLLRALALVRFDHRRDRRKQRTGYLLRLSIFRNIRLCRLIPAVYHLSSAAMSGLHILSG